MKITLSRTVEHTLEIDPAKFAAGFPVEFKEYLEDDWDGERGPGNCKETQEEFLKDSLREVGLDCLSPDDDCIIEDFGRDETEDFEVWRTSASY